MSELNNDPVTTELQTIDVAAMPPEVPTETTNESTLKTRAERIRAILQTAFAETAAELKGGSSELREIAKETVSDFLQTDANSPQQTTAETVVDAPKSATAADEPTLLALLVKWVQVQWANQWKESFYRLRDRAGRVDNQLNEGHRERYQASKEALDQAIAWYRSTMAKATHLEPNQVEQQQAEFETKASAWGVAAAQREQQLKQRIKQWLESAAAKL